MMKTLLPIVGIIILLPSILLSQTKLPGRWSLLLDAGLLKPVSSNQSIESYLTEFSETYEAKKFPFDGISGSFGGKLFYTPPNSSFSPYVGCEMNLLYNSVILDNHNNYVSILDVSWALGLEYAFSIIDSSLKCFGRAGITSNVIVGSINYQYYYYTNIKPAVRFGFELETGLDWVVPGTPLSLELSVGYANTNLIGKNYTEPATLRNSNILHEVTLNDGNSDKYPQNTSKTLDFVWLRIGARLWF